jgi:hypothetical protein
MKRIDHKSLILGEIGQKSEPVSLLDLNGKLGFQCTDRTVRRWLDELIKEGVIRKVGHTKGAKYAMIQAPSQVFGRESLEVIGRIKRPFFERMPVGYNDSWVASYKPNVTFYLSEAFKSAVETGWPTRI